MSFKRKNSNIDKDNNKKPKEVKNNWFNIFEDEFDPSKFKINLPDGKKKLPYTTTYGTSCYPTYDGKPFKIGIKVTNDDKFFSFGVKNLKMEPDNGKDTFALSLAVNYDKKDNLDQPISSTDSNSVKLLKFFTLLEKTIVKSVSEVPILKSKLFQSFIKFPKNKETGMDNLETNTVYLSSKLPLKQQEFNDVKNGKKTAKNMSEILGAKFFTEVYDVDKGKLYPKEVPLLDHELNNLLDVKMDVETILYDLVVFVPLKNNATIYPLLKLKTLKFEKIVEDDCNIIFNETIQEEATEFENLLNSD